MIDRLPDEEEKSMSVAKIIESRDYWRKAAERHKKDAPAYDARIAIANHAHNVAALAHRLDQMHLTMLRILTLMEASHALSSGSSDDSNASGQAKDQG